MADPCSRTWPGARSLSKHWFERRESRCIRYAPLSAGVTDKPAKVQDNSVAQGRFFSDRSVQSIDMLEKFAVADVAPGLHTPCNASVERSEEHTSELQSLMRISYAVFCLKKKKNKHS